jgi:hypothetical protein
MQQTVCKILSLQLQQLHLLPLLVCSQTFNDVMDRIAEKIPGKIAKTATVLIMF